MKKGFKYFMLAGWMGLWTTLGGGISFSQNLAPSFNPIGTRYVKEGDTLKIALFAIDPNKSDILKMGILNSPPTAVFSDYGGGSANFRWVPDFIGPYSSSGSPFELLFVASDGELSTRMEVKVNVLNVNRPPKLILPDSFTVGATTELMFQVRAEDPDKEEIKIKGVNLPDGASLNQKGMFSWMPESGDTGVYNVTFEASDVSGGNGLKEAKIKVIPPTPCVLSIGIEEAPVGGMVKIPINLKNLDPVSGIEILIQYDPSVYTFLGLTKEGTRVSDWEYYVHRERTWGLFQLIKIVGICDFPNELSTLPLSPGSGPIAYLNFKMTSNTQLAGFLVPLEFYYFDFTDNTFSNSMGEFISRDKINLNNGGVLLKSGKTLLGDINLNGIPFDVGDAVRLVAFLTYSFPLAQQQLLNSDVNRDGIWATLADLVYLVTRIQQGGIAPYTDSNPPTEMARVIVYDEPITTFQISSNIEVGGALFVFKGANLDSGDVKLSPEIQDMDLYTYQDGDEFRVMIISTEGKYISPGENSLFVLEGEKNFDSLEVSVCDKEGNLMGVEKIFHQGSNLPKGHTLFQNYPNPFNPVTTIRFKVEGERLKGPTPITLKVYNILGQLVRILVDEEKQPGSYQVLWDGKDQNGEEVSSGIYFYTLKASDYVETKKMILLK